MIAYSCAQLDEYTTLHLQQRRASTIEYRQRSECDCATMSIFKCSGRQDIVRKLTTEKASERESSNRLDWGIDSRHSAVPPPRKL